MDSQHISRALNSASGHIGKRAVVVLYGIGIAVAAVSALQPPVFTNWITEQTLFTFATSLQFFLASLAAFLCFWIVRYNRKMGNKTLNPLLWLAASAAFTFAACDEMLMLHERFGSYIENSFPKIKQVYSRHPSNLFLMVFASGAVVFTVLLMKEIRRVKAASKYYVAGISLMALAVINDTVIKTTPENMVLSSLEELAEFFASTSFAAAFLLYALGISSIILSRWLDSSVNSQEALIPP